MFVSLGLITIRIEFALGGRGDVSVRMGEEQIAIKMRFEWDLGPFWCILLGYSIFWCGLFCVTICIETSYHDRRER